MEDPLSRRWNLQREIIKQNKLNDKTSMKQTLKFNLII